MKRARVGTLCQKACTHTRGPALRALGRPVASGCPSPWGCGRGPEGEACRAPGERDRLSPPRAVRRRVGFSRSANPGPRVRNLPRATELSPAPVYPAKPQLFPSLCSNGIPGRSQDPNIRCGKAVRSVLALTLTLEVNYCAQIEVISIKRL